MSTDRGTLYDIARRTDPDGKPAMVVEVLERKNRIIKDAPTFKSNAPMGQRVTLRSSEPVVQWGKINKGVKKSKSGTKQRVDTIGFLNGLSEVDSRIKGISGEAALKAYRWTEDKAFLSAFGKFVAGQIIYGDERVNEAGFTGFATRMSKLNEDLSESQVHSAGSVSGSDGTSIYIVDWGEDTAHLIHPGEGEGNGLAGVSAEDLGRLRVTDDEGDPFMAWVTEYNWLVGLTVKDPTHIGRLANIDISDANTAAPTQGILADKLDDILSAMPAPDGVQRVMYTHRKLVSAFRKQARNKANMALTMEQFLGKMEPHFWGTPIVSLDVITANESTVT